MILDELKAAVQPLIDDDFDAIYADFSTENPGVALSEFLNHLQARGTLSADEIGIICEVYPELRHDSTHKRPRTARESTPDSTSQPRPVSRSRTASAPRPDTTRPRHRPVASAPRPASASTPPGGIRPELAPPVATDAAASRTPTAEPSEPPPALPEGLRRTGRTSGGSLSGVSSPQKGGRSTGGSSFANSAGAQRTRPLIGRGFKMIGSVGEGAMGKVLLARDLDLARTVAYKEMSPEIARKPELAGKFFCEAQITAQLDHPNIVPIYSLDEGADGQLAYSMKLIKGHTLEHLIHSCIALYDKGARHLDEDHDLPQRLEIFLKVCEAMHYSHSRGVVHRDLKPENIMIGPYGEVYVMDWGIAKVLDPPDQGTSTAWVTLDVPAPAEGEVVIGTPQYMSPEQAEGKTATLTGASDQYSLGLILFELVSLRQAVDGKTPMAIVMKQQDAYKAKLVHYAHKRIPQELRAIIDKATRRKAEDRYPGVHELGEDVRRYLRGDAIHARPDGLIQAVLRWISKHRELTLFGILAGGALFATVILSGIGLSYYQRSVDIARQDQLSEVLSSVGTQAAIVDGQFVKYQGLLGVIAASASEMLDRQPADGAEVYFDHAFNDASSPSSPYAEALQLRDSTRYGFPVSLAHPVFVKAPAMGADVAITDAQRLEPLRRYEQRILLRSHSEEAASSQPRRAERLLLELGVPVAWLHVGLKDGLYLGYPGHGGYPDRFDAREQPWYTLVTGTDGKKFERGERGPQWGAPYVDPTGLGRLLPSAMAIVDQDNNLAGVAAIELTFDYVINELLEIPEFQGRAEFFLLDNTGHIVVRSSQSGSARTGLTARTLRSPTFHVADVVDAITVQGRRSGYLETTVNGQDKLIVWQRMNSLGWFYAVEGDTDVLLHR